MLSHGWEHHLLTNHGNTIWQYELLADTGDIFFGLQLLLREELYNKYIKGCSKQALII